MVSEEITCDATVRLGGHRFGFVDTLWSGFDANWTMTEIRLGPYGAVRSPVSAKTGWALAVVFPLAIAVVAALLVRRIGLHSARHE